MLLVGTITESLYRAWAYVTQGRTFAAVLGIGFALLAITLLIASRTKWGQTKPLTKCVMLSILAHVWLLMYAYGTRVVLPQGDPRGQQTAMAISLDGSFQELLDQQPVDEAESESTFDAAEQPEAWEAPVPLPDLASPALPQPSIDELMKAAIAPALLPELQPTPMPALPESIATTEDDVKLPVVPEQLAAPVLPPTSSDLAQMGEQTSAPATSASLPQTAAVTAPPVPVDYRMRQAENRLQLAMPYGADADSEASVEAGLLWLAKAQSPDGAWNAKQFGGGTETMALGENRHGTGDRADTGVSGLALLAFLSAGHTHLEGKHREVVAKGIGYLMQSQMPSGDLSGPKQIGHDASVTNARMYCHGIATLALAEAYAMTHDERLQDSLVRAAQFTLNAQDVRGGGWRYRAGDAGDLSQFGWQAMALRSVERSA